MSLSKRQSCIFRLKSLKHPVSAFGLSYRWEPEKPFGVTVGDTVQFIWSFPPLVKTEIAVQTGSDSSSISYDGKGFQSAKATEGKYINFFLFLCGFC